VGGRSNKSDQYSTRSEEGYPTDDFQTNVKGGEKG
jgi:hypothetical protein